MKKLFYSRSYLLLLFMFASAVSLFGQDDRGEETVTFDFACPIISITNITGNKDLPQNRNTIGVGESLELSILPKKKVGFKIISPVAPFTEISKKDEFTYTLNASLVNEIIVIEAEIQEDVESCTKKLPITIFVIKPNGIFFEKACGIHQQDKNNVGLKTFLYLTPDNVSFENLKFREEEALAVATGAISVLNGKKHNANMNFAKATDFVSKGKGTLLETVDCAYWNLSIFPEPILDTGNINFQIDCIYQLKSATNLSGLAFCNVSQNGKFERKLNNDNKIMDNFLIQSKGNSIDAEFWKSALTIDCVQCYFK